MGQAIVFCGLPTQTTKNDRLRHQTHKTVLSSYSLDTALEDAVSAASEEPWVKLADPESVLGPRSARSLGGRNVKVCSNYVHPISFEQGRSKRWITIRSTACIRIGVISR